MTQGGVAAVVGAALGATTEPVVNKVLVQRVTLSEALASFSATKALNFFLTATLPTNLLKYPFYEVVNMLLSTVDLPDTGKGVIIGAVFTTVTLPLGSYRCVGAEGVASAARSSLYFARRRACCPHACLGSPPQGTSHPPARPALCFPNSHAQVLRVAEYPGRLARLSLHGVPPHARPRYSLRRRSLELLRMDREGAPGARDDRKRALYRDVRHRARGVLHLRAGERVPGLRPSRHRRKEARPEGASACRNRALAASLANASRSTLSRRVRRASLAHALALRRPPLSLSLSPSADERCSR